MRSRAEWGLRALVVGVLGWYLLHVLQVRRDGVADVATSATLAPALVRWSTVTAPRRVDVTLTHPPAGAERDWLAALAAAHTTVAWRGPALVPTAIAASPRADPVWSATVSVAAPSGSEVVLTDTLGRIDSARAVGGEVLATVPHPRSTLDARVGQVVARAALGDSLGLKRLLIVGTASWETKFTVAALEERGWAVEARLGVSPQADVHQGTIAAIDTGRYAAVLALDSTAAPYAERIARYVRDGGGLVLWPGAASARALASLAPARLGAVLDDEGAAPSDTAPRAVLELVTLTGLTPDAVVVETRGPVVAVAARRAGLGRVVEMGYMTLWRWRMAGGADAPEAHRAWLAGLVASVAYTDRVPRAAAPTDVAPLASLIDRVGPPSTSAIPARAADPTRLAWGVFALIALALLVEWTSRRTRGEK